MRRAFAALPWPFIGGCIVIPLPSGPPRFSRGTNLQCVVGPSGSAKAGASRREPVVGPRELLSGPRYYRESGTLDYWYFTEESGRCLLVLLVSPEGGRVEEQPWHMEQRFLAVSYDGDGVVVSTRIFTEKAGLEELKRKARNGIHLTSTVDSL